MRKKKIILSIFLILLCLFLPLHAVELEKKNGEIITGELTKFVNNIVTIKTEDGEKTVKLSELNDKSVYRVKAHFSDPDNPDEHIKLAQYCLEKGFFAEAILEATQTGEIAEKILENAIKILRKARLFNADKLIKDAEDLSDKKKYSDSLQKLLSVYSEYPEIENREELEKKIKELQVQLGRPKVLPKVLPLPSLLQRIDNNNQPPDKKDKKDEFNLDTKQKKKLKNVKESLNEIRQKIEETITKVKDTRRLGKNSEKNFKNAEEAFSGYISKLKSFDKINTKSEPWLKEFVDEAKRMSKIAQDRIIRISWDMMHINLQYPQPFYRQALRWVNKIMAYDPYNQNARKWRAKITEFLLEKNK